MENEKTKDIRVYVNEQILKHNEERPEKPVSNCILVVACDLPMGMTVAEFATRSLDKGLLVVPVTAEMSQEFGLDEIIEKHAHQDPFDNLPTLPLKNLRIEPMDYSFVDEDRREKIKMRNEQKLRQRHFDRHASKQFKNFKKR